MTKKYDVFSFKNTKALCGMTTTFSDGRFHDRVMTADEDRQTFGQGTERFKLNLKLAEKLGAEKMVLHLWNRTSCGECNM